MTHHPAEPEPRRACAACGRPGDLCYCAHVQPTSTRTRLVVLQHPREARFPLGTVHMVRLLLPEATVRVAVDFADDPVVDRLCAASPRPWLLFPGPGARPLERVTSGPAPTLIAVDGTWTQAKALLRQNPRLAALPRVTLPAGAPSAYRIRRQPAQHCVSTLEAIARALDALEGPGFEARLLRPLHALVDDQLRFSAEQRSYRTRRPRRRDPKPPPPHSLARLRACAERLVCVQGEANAWPRRDPDARPAELIAWRAQRLATGESFAVTWRPRQPLGPATLTFAELDAAALDRGLDWAAGAERWRAFTRPDDVVCSWGQHFTRLADAAGLPLPDARIDLRITSRELGRRLGSVADCAEHLGLRTDVAEPGRCARRAAQLAAIVARLISSA